MLFVLVTRDLGLSSELFGVLIPLFETLPKCLPSLIDLDQNGVGDLAGQGLITFQMLSSMEQFRIGQILAFVNVGLSDVVGGLIVEIFSSKSRGINGRIARIMLCDTVLFD